MLLSPCQESISNIHLLLTNSVVCLWIRSDSERVDEDKVIKHVKMLPGNQFMCLQKERFAADLLKLHQSFFIMSRVHAVICFLAIEKKCKYVNIFLMRLL